MLRLSGELPILDRLNPETACRNCCKKFGFFAPGKRCHHCGYHYCWTCATQGWASWPDGPINRIKVNYTAKNVCCFCVEFLAITSTAASRLNSEDFSRDNLLQYALAYNMVDPGRTGGYPKTELVAAITKLSKDGCSCLPSINERYYRQHSVLNNIPKSQMGSSTGTLQYAAPPRPLCMVWGRNNPWVRPASRDSPNLVASRNILEKSSGSRLLDESRRFSSPASHSTSQVPSQPSPSTTLCVICQDEEANIVIISCGHMALCRGCSDTIMESTRHCPLCRIEISAKDQLVRIYKP